MSMLSAQCDELRTMAESVGLAMPQAATLMMEAADTIEWLERENAKLRELVRDAWGNGHPDKSCGDCEIMDECHAEIEEAHKKATVDGTPAVCSSVESRTACASLESR